MEESIKSGGGVKVSQEFNSNNLKLELLNTNLGAKWGIFLTPAIHPDEMFVASFTKQGWVSKEYFIPKKPTAYDIELYGIKGARIIFRFSLIDNKLILDILHKDNNYTALWNYQNIELLDSLTLTLFMNTINKDN